MSVDLVHLVCLVQPNKPNGPDKQEKPSGSRTSRFDGLTVPSHVEGRARVCGTSDVFSILLEALPPLSLNLMREVHVLPRDRGNTAALAAESAARPA